MDGVLAEADSGAAASEAIEKLLGAPRSCCETTRRLETAMRSSRLPAVKTLAQFDFALQPSIKREQIDSLHELGFLARRENVDPAGAAGDGQDADGPRVCPLGLSWPHYALMSGRCAR